MGDTRTGALLLNLGTPDSPSVPDVRRYLREFLSDPRVIDIPALPRWLLLNFAILPFRPRKSAAAYAKIWTRDGSPLLAHVRALARGVADALGEGWVVELGMRYGRPTIAAALARLREARVSRLVVLPLFPQYAEAATGSALAKFELENARGGALAFDATGSYDSAFAAVLASSVAGLALTLMLRRPASSAASARSSP